MTEKDRDASEIVAAMITKDLRVGDMLQFIDVLDECFLEELPMSDAAKSFAFKWGFVNNNEILPKIGAGDFCFVLAVSQISKKETMMIVAVPENGALNVIEIQEADFRNLSRENRNRNERKPPKTR